MSELFEGPAPERRGPPDQHYSLEQLRDEAAALLCAFDAICAADGLTSPATARQTSAATLPFSRVYERPFEALEAFRGGGEHFFQIFEGRTDFSKNELIVCAVARDSFTEAFCVPMIVFSPTLQTLLSDDSSLRPASVFAMSEGLDRRLSRPLLQAWGSLIVTAEIEPLRSPAGVVCIFSEPESPAPVKVVPLLSEEALAEGIGSARAVSHYIDSRRRAGRQAQVTQIPLPSIIFAVLLSEVCEHESLTVGVSGLSVPEDGLGEYQIGVMTAAADDCAGADNLIAAARIEERVHRVELEWDRRGMLSGRWLGTGGAPFDG